jgi:hypothetical protein
MASFSRLGSTARRVAESKWVGLVITFSALQWWWGSLVVSVAGTVAVGFGGAGIQRTKWARTRTSTRTTAHGIGGLAALLLFSCLWIFFAFREHTDQVIWAVVLSMVFAVLAAVEFLEWRSRVATDASPDGDGTASRH